MVKLTSKKGLKTMKKILISLLVLLTFNSLLSAKEDFYIQGCKDIVADRSTEESAFVMGYIVGTNDLKMDRLDRLGLAAVVDIAADDMVPICRNFLLKLKENPEWKEFGGRIILHYHVRGHIVRQNGYTTDEVKALLEKAQKSLGTAEVKKKY